MTTIQYDAPARSARPQPRRAVGIVAGLAAIGVAALVAVQLGGGDNSTTASSSASGVGQQATTAPQTSVPVDTVAGPAPAGMEMVGDENGPRGYVQAFTSGGEPELLPLGSGEGVSGMEVVNDSDELVGYMLTSIGFVELSEAADPAVIDRLVAEQAALGPDN
ncbi:MAG TPA: hypothetical protein VK507_01905 [Iamia sp.]|nr:hypothetical protein [Iamia sp.]